MRTFADEKQFTVQPECFPCFMRQATIALALGTEDEALKMRVLKAVLRDIEEADTGKSPAHATTLMHRRIREMLGSDPFAGIKAGYNRKALGMYPALRKLVSESRDPLWTASRLAIAGNVIDFGIYTSVDIEGTVRRALEEPLAVDNYECFREALEDAGEVLYLLDNTGEAVFDRLLIEEMISLGKGVTAVAKGSPIINDCTITDAAEAGIDGACRVVDNGSDGVGTILEAVSGDFLRRFREDGVLIVSKGQGNFETLMKERRNIFFLLQSKCGVLSRFLGLEESSMLLAGALCG